MPYTRYAMLCLLLTGLAGAGTLSLTLNPGNTFAAGTSGANAVLQDGNVSAALILSINSVEVAHGTGAVVYNLSSYTPGTYNVTGLYQAQGEWAANTVTITRQLTSTTTTIQQSSASWQNPPLWVLAVMLGIPALIVAGFIVFAVVMRR
jgi:hypothetical protein